MTPPTHYKPRRVSGVPAKGAAAANINFIRKALDNLFRLFKDEQLVGLSLEDRKVIVGIDEILDIPSRYREEYMMLGRLQSDCEYYLHNGGRNPKFLWAQDERKQIAEMRRLYDILPVKPEWLHSGDIDEYEFEMCKIALL